MTEQQDHDAQVRALENEIRQLKQTLLDQFAMSAPAPHIEFTSESAAVLIGREMPEYKPYMSGNSEALAKYHADLAMFRFDLDAKLRFMWADAMLAERQRRLACPTK